MAAIADARFDDKLTAVIVNRRGQRPGRSRALLLDREQGLCRLQKGRQDSRFHQLGADELWAVDRASKLLYAPLPQQVQPTVLETVNKITCNGNLWRPSNSL